MDGSANHAGDRQIFISMTFSGGATLEMTQQRINWRFALAAMKRSIYIGRRSLLIASEFQN
jgi:hypothetical protein